MMRNWMRLIEVAGTIPQWTAETTLTPTAQWPIVLKDGWEIADYIERMSPIEVDEEMIAEHFRGCHATLRMVPISQITPDDENGNIPSKKRQAKYMKMDPKTMPPIVIEDGVIQDGHHRYRVALALGLTEVLCYVVEES